MNQNPLYLIPFDFTPVAESALQIGLDLSKANKGIVILIHVAKSQSDKIEAKLKFRDFYSGLNEEDKKLVDTRVVVGDLFEDIGKAGEILDASLIVMGTHGARGFQKIFGSNAVKLISSSSTPFLITQGKKSVDKMKTIVMPFSFEKKSIQIATFACRIAQKFNATIHLVGYRDRDESFDSHTRSNQIVVEKLLNEKGIEYVIANIPKGSNYEKELMKYAAEVDADLMAAGYYNDGLITNPNSFIQSMIENELHIPVLTVNAEGLTVSASGSAATGY